MHILHIDSSPGAETSYSRKLSSDIVARLQAGVPGAVVTYRDLAASPPPHVDGALRSSWMTGPDQRSDAQVEIVVRCEGYIAEIIAADVIVLGAPMHNLSVPSTLKAWIDHVVIANQTFRYTATGPQGLIEGKRAILALARGGDYAAPSLATMDFQEPYLRSVLGFIGIRNIETIAIEGVALGPNSAARAVARAEERVAAI